MTYCNLSQQDSQRGIVWEVKQRRVRKKHTCRECGDIIQKGEYYMYHHGISVEDDICAPWSSKICLYCEHDWDVVTDLQYLFYGDYQQVFGCLEQQINKMFYDNRFPNLEASHPFWTEGTGERWGSTI